MRARQTKRIETTFGELVAAVTEASAAVANNAAATHALAHRVLNDLFRSRRARFKRRAHPMIVSL